MVHAARNLARIAISAGRAEPVFAGESAQFRLYLDGRAAFDRPSILARHVRSGSQLVVDVPANGIAEVVIQMAAPWSGWTTLCGVLIGMRCLLWSDTSRCLIATVTRTLHSTAL